jgi:hypothetical protein
VSFRAVVGHRSKETISLSSYGLYETWLFRIIPENLPDLADGTIDAVVCVEEGILAPDSFNDLLAGDQLASVHHQQKQELHGDALQLDRASRAAQLVETQVQFEIVAKSDRFLW